MKKILTFLVVIFILFGCKQNKIDWEVKEAPYVAETLQSNPENALVVSRIHNVETNEKYVEFKYYLDWDGVSAFVRHYNKYYPKIDETKDNFKTICEKNLNMKLDEYFYESLEDLIIQEKVDDRNTLSSKLVLLQEDDPTKNVIVTISQGKASYKIWTDPIEIENGTKENLNIESKLYY